MSNTAHNWARDLETLKSSTLKAILKELGSFENGWGYAWESIDTLVRFTDLNRKTVMAGLQELVKRGYLEDTGQRAGSTNRSPVYAFGLKKGFVPDFVRTRQIEVAEDANGPKNGTIRGEGGESPQGVMQPVENTGAAAPDSAESTTSVEQSLKRDDPKNGTVPNTAGDSPVFGQKQSLKRASNGINCNNSSDARTSAAGRARGNQPEQTEPPRRGHPDAQRSWVNFVLREFLVVVGLEHREWRGLPIDRLPEGLAGRIQHAARPLVDRCVAMELQQNLHVSVIATRIRAECDTAARVTLTAYDEANQAAVA